MREFYISNELAGESQVTNQRVTHLCRQRYENVFPHLRCMFRQQLEYLLVGRIPRSVCTSPLERL